MGYASEVTQLISHAIENGYLNGNNIKIDGGGRLAKL
jgi:hypothetical protein